MLFEALLLLTSLLFPNQQQLIPFLLALLIELPYLYNFGGQLFALYLPGLLPFFQLSIDFLVSSLQPGNLQAKSLFLHMQLFDLLLCLFKVLLQLHYLMLVYSIFRLQVKHLLRLGVGLPHQQFGSIESANYRVVPIRNHRQFLLLLLPVRQLLILSSHHQLILIAARPHLHSRCRELALAAAMQIHLTPLPLRLARLNQAHTQVYSCIPIVTFLDSVGQHLSIFVQMQDVAQTYLHLSHLYEPALCAELQDYGRLGLCILPPAVQGYAPCLFLELCLKEQLPILNRSTLSDQPLQ